MNIENFFIKKGPFKLNKIFDIINYNDQTISDLELTDIKNISENNKNEITFFNSISYKNLANKTKASVCITTKKLSPILPNSCIPIKVENVLLITAKITDLFYPNAINDNFDDALVNINSLEIKNNVKYGQNVLIGKNVKFGKNLSVGHNSVIESNVEIGDNCSIGSNVIIRKSVIGNNVNILDSCVIGKKGFGFFPDKIKNIRYPHIGLVIIKDNSEIGCGSTIDRGSLSNTIIGKNTYLDNQVHIAHNVKIGDNCMIAGQVGFAGSSVIGNNVMIGGQAGISGHLKIGNNVQIGGGSGVIKNIPDNSKVMGYPAKDLRSFIKENG